MGVSGGILDEVREIHVVGEWEAGHMEPESFVSLNGVRKCNFDDIVETARTEQGGV
eukprot:CAMPEP_0184678902 /NCGR_PEP_ID=MMETSP0312-20130426/1719_1 /TAXON_ID=31354 /ORGANISM="Compsopogon coeruleus, Strain SAG 36.94" /LENGTH=55 /DNA_ID=CAMNT_0027128001 /DNA_START=378 /DNA_END=545 /DNA_ORIENTATION=+